MWNEILRTLQPGAAQQADIQQEDREQKKVATSLNAKINALKVLKPDDPNRSQYINEIMQDPQYKSLLGNFPVQDGQNQALDLDKIKKIQDLQANNIDVETGEVLDARLQKMLGDEMGSMTGKQSNIDPATGQEMQMPSVGQMLDPLPQDQGRRWWDDTVSPESIKQAAKNYESQAQAFGLTKEEARDSFTRGYADVVADDNGLFRKYPENFDVTKVFKDEDKRNTAVEGGTVVVDIGDGQNTVPFTNAEIGIADPQMAEEFNTLTKMVGDAIPDLDLRQDFKSNPDFYKKLMDLIKNGVPDEKDPTKKRKLSIIEIIDFIKGS